MAAKAKLRPGNKAPDFYTVDARGVRVGLADYKGVKQVALVFLRYAGCPICQLALQDLKKNYPKFEEKGAEVVVFVQSPRESIEKAGGAEAFPFRVVPDPEGEFYALYGVGGGGVGSLLAPKTLARAAKATLKGHRQGKMEGNTWQLPGDFVVGKDGVLKLARVGANMGDNLTAKELLSYL